MDDLPLVSIVTPSLNQGRFIRDAIESVLSQDYPKIEYIVMDGGSTDDTLTILRSYDHRLVWTSKPDLGQADAVNAGFHLAKGEIFGWLNSDDTYLPGAVKAAVDHLSTSPDTAAVYGDAYYIDDRNSVIGIYPTEDFDLNRLAEACTICQPAAFVRRAAFNTVGGLDTTLEYCMDYDLWIRLGQRFRIERIPRYMANSRQYPQTKTWSCRQQLYAEIYAVAERSFGYISPHWRLSYAYYRFKGLSWPLVRRMLYPAQRFLPERVHHWMRMKPPLFINRVLTWNPRLRTKR
jgi:glycosyltransferase involved in cell wall biosynthesis